MPTEKPGLHSHCCLPINRPRPREADLAALDAIPVRPQADPTATAMDAATVATSKESTRERKEEEETVAVARGRLRCGGKMGSGASGRGGARARAPLVLLRGVTSGAGLDSRNKIDLLTLC